MISVNCPCGRARAGCTFHDPRLQPRSWSEIVGHGWACDVGSRFCLQGAEVGAVRGETWSVGDVLLFGSYRGRVCDMYADGSVVVEVIS